MSGPFPGMNSAIEFLGEIARDPDNDAPRLAYAEWLVARKDPRGEFIRNQVTLAGLDPSDPGWAGLKQRETLLLKKHAQAWNAELPPWARHHAPTFHRGFPEIRCQVDDWLRGARDLVKWFPLDRVNMKATATTLSNLASSVELQAARLLDLSYSPLDDASLAELVDSPNLVSLTGFYLWHCGLGADAARAIAASPYLAGLTRLVLEENRIAAAGVAALAESPHLVNLVRLNLRSIHFGPDGGNALAKSPNLAKLESLNLGNNDLGTEAGGTLLQTSMPHLKSLSIDGNDLQDGGALALADASHLRNLESLQANYNQFTALGIKAIAQARHLSHLRELDLSANPMGAAGAMALAKSRTLANLSELILSSCEIGDQGAAAIAESRYLKGLQTLHLSDGSIGNTGALALANSKSLTTLVVLSMRGNAFDNSARKALRDCFGKRVQM